jgi:small subunit ribosomal protein S19e
MATVYDVPADKLVRETALDLKDNVKMGRPEWASYVKTGASKERKPADINWWWTRAASILKRIYLEGPVGVQRLRTCYGGRKNRGHKPEEFRRASGKVIRTILKELDTLGFTEVIKGGRRITPKGHSYLDKISSKLAVQKDA